MISLKKTFAELDQITALQETCEATIQSIQQYPVIVNANLATAFQEQLQAVLLHFAGPRTAEAQMPVASRVRAILRDYQEASHQQLAELRSDMEATMSALREVTEVLTSRDEDHQAKLREEVGRLQGLADSPADPRDLRDELRKAVRSIAQCIQEIERENRLTVAQLKNELALLHRRVDLARQAAAVDPVTGLLHSAEMKSQIARAVTLDHQFSMVFVRVTNYRRLALHVERRIIDAALADLGQRMKSLLKEGDLLGRWSEEEFVAVIEADRVRALQASKDISARCSGPYPVNVAGQLHTASLSVASGIVDRKPDEGIDALLRRAEQLLRVLVG